MRYRGFYVRPKSYKEDGTYSFTFEQLMTVFGGDNAIFLDDKIIGMNITSDYQKKEKHVVRVRRNY